jgi:hypothetical protein
MDQGHAFMMRALEHPVRECMEPLVSLRQLASDAGVEVAFSDRPHVQGLPRLYVLRQGQAAGFVGAARDFNRRGWVMRVEDGFRSRVMQKHIGRQPLVFDAVLAKVIWECHGATPDPDLFFRRVLTMVAQFPKCGTHMSGSAIDISVLRRGSGQEVDRGGPYLEMSELTPMDSPFVSDEVRHNRQAITQIMRANGFVEYPFEFWHFSSGDVYEPLVLGRDEPGRYGAVDYDIAGNTIHPITDPRQQLNSLAEIQAEMHAAMRRLGGAR